ncbi:MAG: rhodanese-like domain-containing protein [archaeon]|nr:rhodanese-like domain-containing protein [archaeon]
MPVESVTMPELRKLIDSALGYVLIDVREQRELVHGVIPTAKHIPLPELTTALEMPAEDFEKKYGFKKPGKKDNLVFYCRTGGRSHTAAMIAKQKGFNAKNFVGGIYEWSAIDPRVKKY